MDFISAQSAQNEAFEIFEDVCDDLLKQAQILIQEAVAQGNVSTTVSFHKPENKNFSREHRMSLVAYLRHNGYKAEYLNKEIDISWGAPS